MLGDPVGVGVAEVDGVTEGVAAELELGLVVGEADGDVVGVVVVGAGLGRSARGQEGG
jgi:hypothetical protein